MSLVHLTLQTGHQRVCERAEVGDGVIRILKPLLRNGTHPLPRLPGYSLHVTVEGAALMASVWTRHHDSPSGVPLTTTGVATNHDSLAALQEIMGDGAAAVATAPACIVRIHPTIILDMAAAEWLGDFERCLAWAWVEDRRCRGVA